MRTVTQTVYWTVQYSRQQNTNEFAAEPKYSYSILLLIIDNDKTSILKNPGYANKPHIFVVKEWRMKEEGLVSVNTYVHDEATAAGILKTTFAPNIRHLRHIILHC